MNDEIIVVKNLSKSFGEVKAVRDISFNVKKGEKFAFLGVNGAGKSTTISMICGLLQKDKGAIFVDGNDIEKDTGEIKHALGIVFQNSVLDKKLTVRDNLKYRASLYGIFDEELANNLRDVSKHLHLNDILDRPVEKLSGGQKRRADIARALIHKPKILILDEPTTGLDPATRKLVWEAIDELQKRNSLTVFLTTHYMEEATTADRITIIEKGQIIAAGTPLELKNQFASDSLYLYDVKSKDVKDLGLKYEKVADGYKLELPNVETVIRLVKKNPELFKDFEVIKGRMDDVFINATGRKELE